MVSLPLCHIDGKRQEKEWYVPNPAIYIRTLVHIFIPFGLHSSRTLNPGRPMMIWSAIKLPDGLRSFTELRICGTSSVCCGDTFRTPSASGLTSCPSFSFSATSGVGGSSSNCIFRSSAASSDFNCFSSSSFFHTFPAISYNCETSFSCTSFFALYWSMMTESSPMRSGNCVRRLPGQPSPACSLCHTRILILRENLSSM